MFVAAFFVTILFLIFIIMPKKKNKSDFPLYPEALPIIGNGHIFLGDNVRKYLTFTE